jgi:hypothetical protein
MTAVATPTRSGALAPADQRKQRFTPQTAAPPIVAAVDGSAASTAAVDTAVRLAAEMDAPLDSFTSGAVRQASRRARLPAPPDGRNGAVAQGLTRPVVARRAA